MADETKIDSLESADSTPKSTSKTSSGTKAKTAAPSYPTQPATRAVPITIRNARGANQALDKVNDWASSEGLPPFKLGDKTFHADYSVTQRQIGGMPRKVYFQVTYKPGTSQAVTSDQFYAQLG